MTYAEQLKSPKWQKKRLEILERDSFTCTSCGEKEKQLHVHHGYYEKNVLLWDYVDETLHTLCLSCHDKAHEDLIKLKTCIAYIEPKNILALHKLISEVFFHTDKDIAINNITFYFNTINDYNHGSIELNKF